MSRKIFVNLPVRNLDKSVEFFTALGFGFDPRFTDESATCMPLSEEAFVMLLVDERFKDFTKKSICETTTHTEALLAITADSRAEVDALVHTALEAGGSASMEPQDLGFMYNWSFQDIDGHCWEVVWMDPEAAGQQDRP